MTDPPAGRGSRSGLYLLTSALHALNTAWAFRPLRLPGPATWLSLMLSWPIGELPLYNLGANAVTTALAVRRGALHTRAGRVGFALSAASAAALIELERRGRQATRPLEAALVEGLGPDYWSRIERPRLPGPHAAVAARRGVARIWRIRRSYAHDVDISYGPHGASNLLDIWRRPASPPTPAPRCCFRFPAAPGSPVTRRDRPIRS